MLSAVKSGHTCLQRELARLAVQFWRNKCESLDISLHTWVCFVCVCVIVELVWTWTPWQGLSQSLVVADARLSSERQRDPDGQ